MRYEALSIPERIASVSLDLEEDHAGLSSTLKYEAAQGLAEMAQWFKDHQIPLTIFVAGNYLEQQGKSLEGLSSVEFHSHGYWHPPHAEMWKDEIRTRNIQQGLDAFKAFFKRPSMGYRAGCGILKEADFPLLARQGVQFDSSFFTGAHVSGLHLFRSSRPRWYGSIPFLEIPISAHPFFRLPVSMAYMKLLGAPLFGFPQRLGMGLRPLVFNFHLHDLFETSIYKGLSPFWKWIYGGSKPRQKMTDWLLKLKASGVTFVSMGQLHDRLKARAPRP